MEIPMQAALTTFLPAMPELVLLGGLLALGALLVIGEALSIPATPGAIIAKLQHYTRPRGRFFFTFLLLLCTLVLFLLVYQKWSLAGGAVMRPMGDPNTHEATFAGLFLVDSFIHLTKVLVVGWLVLFLIVTGAGQEHPFSPTGLFCLGTSALGALFALSSDDLLGLVLSLEVMSIGLALFLKLDNDAPSDAPFNFFCAHSIGAGLLILGAAMLYSLLGTTDFSLMLSSPLRDKPTVSHFNALPAVAVFFLGLFCKMLFLPLQGVFLSTCEKSRTYIFLLLDFLPRFVGLALVIRLFTILNLENFRICLFALGLAGMALGSLNTLNQNQIKNMLACETISKTGLCLVLFAAAGLSAVPCLLFLICVDSLVLLVYLGTTRYLRAYGRPIATLNDLCFVKYELPTAALLIGGSILCLVGLPPLPGFLPLVVAFKTLILEHAHIALFAICLCKLISVANAVRILSALFVKNPLMAQAASARTNRRPFTSLEFIGLASLIALLIAGTVYTDRLLSLFEIAESALRYYSES